ncbi:MAG: transporter [Bacteroidetes bacterium]|nr:MAG: transporter [Bacteroidota bacterium]
MKNRIILLFILAIVLKPLAIQAQYLEDYLKYAAENNVGLKATYAEFEASMQRIEQVNTLSNPTFSFGYFISPVETRVGPQRMKFSLSQMFPWFGTLDAKEDIASKLAESRYQEFIAYKLGLYLDVKKAYFTLIELNDHIRLQQENLTLLTTYKELANIQFANGKGPMVDVLRADVRIENIQIEISLLREKVSPLSTHFNLLLNRSSDTKIEMEMLDSIVNHEVFYTDSIFKKNPTIASFNLKINAVSRQADLAKLSGLPSVGLGLDYVVVSKRNIGMVADDGKDILMPMATISLPIFRSRYKAAISEASHQKKALQLHKEQFKNNLNTEFAEAQYKLSSSMKLIRLYKSEINAQSRILDLLFTSYSTSGRDFVEVIRNQQQLITYKMKLSSEMMNCKIAISQLEYLTNKQ